MPTAKVHAPIKTEGLTLIYSGCEPQADYTTGEVRIDRASGLPLFRAHVMALLPGEVRPQVWAVTVVGEPKGIQQGQAVGVDDLMASEWEIEDRHGIGFKASAIYPANATARSRAEKAEAA